MHVITDIEQQIRPRESFLYAKEITKPFGVVDQVIDWCKTEMQGDWRWQLIDTSSDQRPGCYIFYFDREQDLCTFVLKWG